MSDTVEHADDICALPLVRRLAALLDRDSASLEEGDPLPHGWHVALFNPPTRQSRLRADGAAQLGVTLPDLGLPRLMMGGRRIDFVGEIPIGARVMRTSRPGAVAIKEGRSGRFALIDVEHRITLEDGDEAVLVETNSYVLREAVSEDRPAPPAPAATPIPPADVVRTVTPDETLLFRYSAITDNPHRIHYDLPYAHSEGYPALVVNGSVPIMLLLEMFRAHAGGEPAGLRSRNLAPIFAGASLTLTLTLAAEGDGWTMRAHGPAGDVALEATAWV